MVIMDWIEIIKQISILFGIGVAIYGIDAWRREHVGKRQLELAEDTLALFYEAADAIKHIRHPASFGQEQVSARLVGCLQTAGNKVGVNMGFQQPIDM